MWITYCCFPVWCWSPLSYQVNQFSYFPKGLKHDKMQIKIWYTWTVIQLEKSLFILVLLILWTSHTFQQHLQNCCEEEQTIQFQCKTELHPFKPGQFNLFRMGELCLGLHCEIPTAKDSDIVVVGSFRGVDRDTRHTGFLYIFQFFQ